MCWWQECREFRLMIGLGLFFLIFLQKYPLYSENFYLWRNNILIRALHCKKENVSLQCLAGEMAGYVESVFCFILNTEIANFNRKDRDNSNAHSVYVYIMLKGQPMLYPCMLYMYQCENIVSSFIFPRCLAIPDVDEQDKSHTFFVYIR